MSSKLTLESKKVLLDVRNLHVHYGGAEALKGISLQVAEGLIVALIGANGAGKTTLLRSISGLKVPTSGEIEFQGRSIGGLPPQTIVRLGICHVPEGGMLFAQMTVLENLKMGAYLRKNRGLVEETLGRVFHHFPILKERQGQRAGSLSGGERQMLAVGRALMAHPKLLLLDELSLGLSPIMTLEIARIIAEINQEGVSIALVEQNARMALKLAHKAYVLETGCITLEGDAKELLNDEKVKEAYLGM